MVTANQKRKFKKITNEEIAISQNEIARNEEKKISLNDLS